MLRRRSKRRYLSIIHAGESSASLNAITKRFCELFGTIAAEKAAIRLVREETIAMSGSIRQLRRQRQQYSDLKTRVI